MPIDRSTIDAQLQEIGEGDRWWEQREFRDLPHILHAEERIRGITLGKLLGPRRPRLKPSGRWLLVVTTQRLLCLRQERFARKQVELAAGQIVRLHPSSRMRAYQLVVETPQRRFRIRIPKVDAVRFASALSALIPAPQSQAIDPVVQQWAWIPGMSTVAALPGVRGILSNVSMLSPPDFATREHLERVEATVERLQGEVERLQQQVVFLEDLLQKRAEEAYLPPSSLDA